MGFLGKLGSMFGGGGPEGSGDSVPTPGASAPVTPKVELPNVTPDMPIMTNKLPDTNPAMPGSVSPTPDLKPSSMFGGIGGADATSSSSTWNDEAKSKETKQNEGETNFTPPAVEPNVNQFATPAETPSKDADGTGILGSEPPQQEAVTPPQSTVEPSSSTFSGIGGLGTDEKPKPEDAIVGDANVLSQTPSSETPLTPIVEPTAAVSPDTNLGNLNAAPLTVDGTPSSDTANSEVVEMATGLPDTAQATPNVSAFPGATPEPQSPDQVTAATSGTGPVAVGSEGAITPPIPDQAGSTPQSPTDNGTGNETSGGMAPPTPVAA